MTLGFQPATWGLQDREQRLPVFRKTVPHLKSDPTTLSIKHEREDVFLKDTMEAPRGCARPPYTRANLRRRRLAARSPGPQHRREAGALGTTGEDLLADSFAVARLACESTGPQRGVPPGPGVSPRVEMSARAPLFSWCSAISACGTHLVAQYSCFNSCPQAHIPLSRVPPGGCTNHARGGEMSKNQGR